MKKIPKLLNGQSGLIFGIAIIAVIVFVRVSCSSMKGNEYVIDIPGTPDVLQTFNEYTASEITANIKIGLNFGNTLDAHYDINGFPWLGGGSYKNTSVSELERAWQNPSIREDTVISIKEAGFNAVRIPVTWYKAIDSNNIIRKDWMTRIVEVVNYAIDNDMYVVLNSHHDEEIFKFTNAQTGASLIAFRKIWEQIAGTFRNYDERLIFEALNEPRTKGSPNEWSGGTTEEHLNINKYYQAFVDIVRASGGNNGKRVLMVNSYAASAEQIAMDGLVIPKDTIPDRIVVSIHAYSPYYFALHSNESFNKWNALNPDDTSPITGMMDRIYRTFISKGIPVIMGEFGAMNKNNDEARAAWAEFYVKTAMDRGIPCFWWDNGIRTGSGEKFALVSRHDGSFPFPEVVAGLMRGVSGWNKEP
ncbi:MAG: glycoside hydrolase family 5 protein [Treponema sp.]|nr:glycoside hydrolase family 5 protein [Treponema sp.]